MGWVTWWVDIQIPAVHFPATLTLTPNLTLTLTLKNRVSFSCQAAGKWTAGIWVYTDMMTFVLKISESIKVKVYKFKITNLKNIKIQMFSSVKFLGIYKFYSCLIVSGGWAHRWWKGIGTRRAAEHRWRVRRAPHCVCRRLCNHRIQSICSTTRSCLRSRHRRQTAACELHGPVLYKWSLLLEVSMPW